jgi:hypothetical protein
VSTAREPALLVGADGNRREIDMAERLAAGATQPTTDRIVRAQKAPQRFLSHAAI